MRNGSATSSRMRVLLLKREAFRVGPSFRGLRVRSGRAWVTVGGRDLTLPRGHAMALDPDAGPAVVSPLGLMPVVIELLGDAPPGAASDAG